MVIVATDQDDLINQQQQQQQQQQKERIETIDKEKTSSSNNPWIVTTAKETNNNDKHTTSYSPTIGEPTSSSSDPRFGISQRLGRHCQSSPGGWKEQPTTTSSSESRCSPCQWSWQEWSMDWFRQRKCRNKTQEWVLLSRTFLLRQGQSPLGNQQNRICVQDWPQGQTHPPFLFTTQTEQSRTLRLLVGVWVIFHHHWNQRRLQHLKPTTTRASTCFANSEN